MSNQVAVFDPLTKPSGSFNTQLPNGVGTIHIINDSHVTLNFSINNFASMVTTVPAGATVNIPMCPPYVTVYWSTATKLVTSVKIISSRVVVMAYGAGEPVPAEKATSRQVNPSNTGFSFGGLIGIAQFNLGALSLFNPLGSGVNAEVYSVLYVGLLISPSSPALWPTTVDPALTPVTPTNDILGGPASAMSVTTSANTVQVNPGLDVIQCGGNSQEFITFPHQIIVPPGHGLVLSVASNIAGTNNVSMGFKWNETLV